jgi:hypothetical protein
MLRPCLDCGTLSEASRCPGHATARQRAKDAQRPERRSHAEQERKRALIAEHVTLYGWRCPGAPDLDHPPHPSDDLTADHLVPVHQGGAEGGPLRVLCRSKNSGRR